ncbi:hypothetical protein GCM10027400_00880 [Pseudoxanthomonas daejeonensis]
MEPALLIRVSVGVRAAVTSWETRVGMSRPEPDAEIVFAMFLFLASHDRPATAAAWPCQCAPHAGARDC